ncbi:MAG: hypothetical protein CVV21_08860 [Candidatus Goldiibacteriota bacterium HGW-Goldbacteria-1]|jgi:hypothetical protein|nr:MAG: hypothetical protein CVV21_08860 [Candidatus Goldiibacteriota bacterium HGW-Goldbacteria-1]
MKVIMMWIMALMFSAVAVIAVADDNFAVKADECGKKVESIEKKLSKLEIKNTSITETINHLKGQKKGVIRDFFLWYFLVRGNKTAFKIEEAEQKIRETKDDYFTYNALVLEEHNRRFRDCLKEKCPDAAAIFVQRRVWSDKVINFKDVFELDVNYGLAAGDSRDSKDDVREYYAKKMMQAEQRLIILNDEKNIIVEAKKAGIVSNTANTDTVNEKIKEMTQIKKKLEALPASAGGR